MPRGGSRKGAGRPVTGLKNSASINICITAALKSEAKAKAQALNTSLAQYITQLIKKDDVRKKRNKNRKTPNKSQCQD